MAAKVTVKWGAKTLELEVDPASSVPDLKAQLFSLTAVPPDRQKLMSKAWKGVLRDDGSLASVADGLAITLMGSADVAAARPADAATVKFVEDLPASAGVKAGHALPSGLKNFENVCYANSTLEVRVRARVRVARVGARATTGRRTSRSAGALS